MQKRKNVPSRGVSVGNGLEVGECSIALGLGLNRVSRLHVFVDVLGKGQRCPPGIWEGQEPVGHGAEGWSLGQAGLSSN